MATTKVYLTEDGWTYAGVKQKVGELKGISSTNHKLWTMLGALILELISSGIYDVKIYNDSRLVEEWNEEVSFIERQSKDIAVRLKNEFVKKFIKFSIVKLDRHSLDKELI